MDLSIIVRCGDDPRIRKCLSSIDEDIKLVLVTNKPSNYMRGVAQDYSANLIETQANIAEMQNIGIKAAQTTAVLLLDSDTVVKPGSIAKLYSELEKNPDAMIKGSLEFSHNNALNKVVADLRYWHNRGRAYTPFLAFSKGVDSKMGGYYFNSRLPYVEDHDFDKRRRKAGIPLLVKKDAVAVHDVTTLMQDFRRAWKYGTTRARLSPLSLSHAVTDLLADTAKILQEQSVATAVYFASLWRPTYLVAYYAHRKKAPGHS